MILNNRFPICDFFKSNYDKNQLVFYKDNNQIEFIERKSNISLIKSTIYNLYNSLTFYFIDLDFFKNLFININNIAQKYSFYKQYDYSEHFNLFNIIFNEHKKSKIIHIKIPYDVVASLGPGRLSSFNGTIILNKVYIMNEDFSLSESIDIHFPTRNNKKIYIRILRKKTLTELYYSKDDINYTKTDLIGLYEFIDKFIFMRYQSTVNKQLDIKNAAYSSEYIELLKMIKI